MRLLKILGAALLLSYFMVGLAQAEKDSPVETRIKKEKKVPADSFAGTFYKPTYVLPYYYTGSPDNAVYQGHTPNGESIKHTELKYQLSFKVPLWKNIYQFPTSLYFAYTQMSYWQVYNGSSFFRETDYEPELFLANEIQWNLPRGWSINSLNLGITHQSNGVGGSLERSWNRIYLEAMSSVGDWMISVRPWYILHDGSLENHNPNIGKFMGYGKVIAAYKYHHQVFSFAFNNFIESQMRRPTLELTWSIPITAYLKVYTQVFSGYGQSLIEYNHHTNSVGIGIAFSDWV